MLPVHYPVSLVCLSAFMAIVVFVLLLATPAVGWAQAAKEGATKEEVLTIPRMQATEEKDSYQPAPLRRLRMVINLINPLTTRRKTL